MHRKIYQKKLQSFKVKPRVYGTFYIGATTPSYDLETEIDQTFPVAHINEALIHETVKQFLGK
jgi:tRNA pseudouridine55 synthase